jgi:acid phosphatase (class A)
MHPAKITLRSLALAAMLLAGYVAPLRAQDTMVQGTKPAKAKATELHYLPAGKPDGVTLLAPPPLADSPEQAADMAETVAVHAQVSAADEAAAKSERKVNIFAFTPAIGSFFQPGKLPKTEAFLKNVIDDTEAVEDKAKEFWKRPRPYTANPALARGADDLEKSFSYPSGHSTRGTVFALVLAELFPDKSEGILATGREIGWHRVEIARHYPTDIYAGRVIAQAIVRELKNSPKFRTDFAEAQKEISSVLAAEKQTPAPAAALAH